VRSLGTRKWAVARPYLSAYHADRMIRTVMRVSVQASISAVQMSTNSLKYVTSMTIVFTGCPVPEAP
jgi:hypothetical protein